MKFLLLVIATVSVNNLVSANDEQQVDVAPASELKNKPHWALIRSSGGCILKIHMEVREFIFKDMKLYENLYYDQKVDLPNEIFFLDENDKVLEHIYLNPYTREQINQLLVDRGFVKKVTEDQIKLEQDEGKYLENQEDSKQEDNKQDQKKEEVENQEEIEEKVENKEVEIEEKIKKDEIETSESKQQNKDSQTSQDPNTKQTNSKVEAKKQNKKAKQNSKKQKDDKQNSTKEKEEKKVKPKKQKPKKIIEKREL